MDREVRRSGLCLNRRTLAAALGREPTGVKGRSRERRKRAGAAV